MAKRFRAEDRELSARRDRLWALAYRITGSSVDADDIVQDTFVRFMSQRSPSKIADLDAWLFRVATNLGIDVLRRRRRRAYCGPWLPAVFEAPDPPSSLVEAAPDASVRYDFAESATFAFLVALEALSPRQRAALLLREVFGSTTEETAAVLGTTAGSVRILHLRARRALEAYDLQRCVPDGELRQRHQWMLQRLLECLATQDAAGLEALFCEGARALTDGGGRYSALTRPLSGRIAVARFYLKAALNRRGSGAGIEVRMINGLPAALITLAAPVRRQAPRSVLRFELSADDRIETIQTIMAPEKLSGLRP